MAPTTNHHNPRVLVVDDERIIADTLTAILAKAGYDARSAYSGGMAIEMARNFQPELLIADVVMPGMTGIDVAILLRATLPSCKVLLFSGNAATPGLLEGPRARNHEFALLAKPVHPTELIAKMQSILNG